MANGNMLNMLGIVKTYHKNEPDIDNAIINANTLRFFEYSIVIIISYQGRSLHLQFYIFLLVGFLSAP